VRVFCDVYNRQFSIARGEVQRAQADDVKIFFNMVSQHQSNFDATWSQKTLEHKLRADDLIDALKVCWFMILMHPFHHIIWLIHVRHSSSFSYRRSMINNNKNYMRICVVNECQSLV
jgi:hypothetical protein